MSSAPHATFCEWNGWNFVLDDPGLVYVGQGKIPVLAFTAEAERDEAADLLAHWDDTLRMLSDGADGETLALVATLRTRLAKAERLLGECIDYEHPGPRLTLPNGGYCQICECEWQGEAHHMPGCPAPAARRFLQGESKDG